MCKCNLALDKVWANNISIDNYIRVAISRPEINETRNAAIVLARQSEKTRRQQIVITFYACFYLT